MTTAAPALDRLGVKLFAAEAGAVALPEFIPVFHRWIQTRRIGGILIDVADYAHLPNGPGVALIGHEGDWMVDASEGAAGLLHLRKRGLSGTAPERILQTFRGALDAAAKLEEDLGRRLTFRTDEVLFLVNDRLAAVNSEESFGAIRGDLEAAVSKLLPGASLSRANDDPRDRLAVRLACPGAPAGVSALLSRLP